MSSASTPGESSLTVAADTALQGGTAIGVDVGKKTLLALAPADATPSVTNGHKISGNVVDAVYATLQSMPRQNAVGHELLQCLTQLVEDAAAEAVAYAETYPQPVLVIEAVAHSKRPLTECLDTDARVACWLLAALREELLKAAAAAGVPVVEVNEEYTTQQCHVCDQLGNVGANTIACPTASCPVGRVCRDLSAAASIAQRFT